MPHLRIPLDGKETDIEFGEIEIDNLELDETNPRISLYRDNQITGNLSRDQIIYALTNKNPDAFRKLKDSIHNNRGIMYPVWVEPLECGKYKVIEGNSRVVAYQQLREEEPFERKWKSILSNILPHKVSGDQKDFIRLQSHLRGTTEWDAYEKAKYLYKLWQAGWSTGRLEKQTKMREAQILENIEAYQIMEEQYLPEHTDDPNEVSKFSYFVEYVGDKKLRKSVDEHFSGVQDFCLWVGDKTKIPRGQDVRLLGDILANEDTRDKFASKGFEEALHLLELKKPHLVSSFYRDLERALEGLKRFKLQDLDEITLEDGSGKEKLIRDLADWSRKIVNLIDRDK